MKNSTIKNSPVLLIGANGGLGKETAIQLLEDGYSNLVMACRTESKGNLAKKEILQRAKYNGTPTISVKSGFNMTDPKGLKTAVEGLQEFAPFKTVFLGAGGVIFTEDYQSINYNGKKVEKTVFQNVIGAHIVLATLKKKQWLQKGCRVVVAGGEGARGIKGMIEKPNFRTVDQLKRYIHLQTKEKGDYNPMNAIGVSKLLGALWTIKVAEIEREEMELVWFTPGLTYGTDGLSSLPTVKRWFMEKLGFGIMRLLGLAQSPKHGGRKFADCLEGKIGFSGQLLGAPEGKTLGKIVDQKPMNANFTNASLIEGFWYILEDIYGPYPMGT